MNEIEFFLVDLESKFKKINPKEYYLSYSGGKDSHFLYWFIKEYMHDTDIEIVSANTYMEHDEMIKRMYANADTILLPDMKPFDIKEKYGIPCFSKIQDDWISRYQKGNRKQWLINRIKGEDGNWSKFTLNKQARKLLLENKLHKISPYIYTYISRTGCAGCPYGSWKGETNIELDLLNDNKRKFIGEYFKESYKVLGIDTKFKQERLF